MAAKTKTVTSYFASKGVNIVTDDETLTITTLDGDHSFDITLPGLHLRILEAAKEALKDITTANIKADSPYTTIVSQLERLGINTEANNGLLHNFQLLKEATKTMSITTQDFGDNFDGIYENEAGEYYVRTLTSDPEVIEDLSYKYPDGLVAEREDVILFIYGEFKGAAAGYCPPLPKGMFDTVAVNEILTSTLPMGSSAGSIFGDDDDLFSDLSRETLSPKELKARDTVNTWVTKHKFGDRFTINNSGEFNNPAVISSFATQRFAQITMCANINVYKMIRVPLSSRLLDAAEEKGGQINALHVVALCMRGSKINGSPDWALFLKFLEHVVPTCLQYLGGRFVLKGGAAIGTEFAAEDDFEL